MSATVRCLCCGVDVAGARVAIARCTVCDLCDGSHGFERQQRLIRLVAMGRLSPYRVLAAVALDDAWLSGKLVISASGDATIPVPVRRWEVVLGWARCREETVRMETVVEAALAPFQNVEPTPDVMERAKAEIREALTTWNPSINVDFTLDPAEPARVVFTDESVELPSDVLSQPARGSS